MRLNNIMPGVATRSWVTSNVSTKF